MNMQNMIDWMNLDNDLVAIRSRNVGVRRLQRVEEKTEIMLEIIAYAIPLALLLSLALYNNWKRSNLKPLTAKNENVGNDVGRS